MSKVEVKKRSVNVDNESVIAISGNIQAFSNQLAAVDQQIKPAIRRANELLEKFQKDTTGELHKRETAENVTEAVELACQYPRTLLKKVKTYQKEVENARVAKKAPVLELGREIDSWYKPEVDACAVIIKDINQLINTCDNAGRSVINARNAQIMAERKKIEEQEALQRKLAEEMAPEGQVVDITPLEKPVLVQEYKPTDKVKNWKFRILDQDAVPEKIEIDGDLIRLKTVDEVKIGKIARKHHDKFKIPGVEFYFEESTRV